MTPTPRSLYKAPRAVALENVATAVISLFHRFRQVAEELHPGAVSPGMRAVARSLYLLGPKSVPELARMRPVSRQHIQGLVNRLRAAGWAAYGENPAHRRSPLVALTPAGRRGFERMVAVEEAALSAFDPGIPLEDLESAAATLKGLRQAFDSPRWSGSAGGRAGRSRGRRR